MPLLERVTTLVRANLNDLIDKAEDPEKMLKQVILDMENQLVQVKTQVAVAIADEHMLEKKRKENEEKMVEWMRKAELAVQKGKDDLARAALEGAGGGPARPGGEFEDRTLETRAKAGGGALEERRAHRQAPPGARAHQG
jgi:phage shock protein A